MKKSALITGAEGFIGSHLCEMLYKLNYKVNVVTQYNSFNSHGWLENSKYFERYNIYHGDLRDENFCNKITFKKDIVFNLASLIAIPFSYESPKLYFDNNVGLTLNLLNSCRLNKVKRLIHVSSSEVYGTAQYVPIDEKHPLQPQSPYSASKISADAAVFSFYCSYGLPISIVRPFNTYGPRQSSRAIIPTIISQLLSGKKIINLGDLSPTRDFNYVLDTCRGIIEISKSREAIGEIINIGSGSEISIKNLFHLINKIMNLNAKTNSDKSRIRPKKSEVKRLLCDNTKMKRLTNFSNKVSLEEGLKKTIKWMEKQNISSLRPDKYVK